MRCGPAGTALAERAGMAAVLCLVFLPLIASVGFMAGAIFGDMSVTSALGGITFLALAGVILSGALSLARTWDVEH